MKDFYNYSKGLQAAFRDTSCTISEQGRTHADDMGWRNRHLLALCCEHENLYPSLRNENGVRKFFTDRRIKWSSSDYHGPPRSMVSSQVLCVNFLMPLAGIPGAMEAAISAIDGDVKRIVSIPDQCAYIRASTDSVCIYHDVGSWNSPVEFEWTGLGYSLEGGVQRGENNTSVDAFVVAETDAGRRAYLMEWKYSERYSRTDYGVGKSGDTRRRRYSDWYHARASSFSHKVPMNKLLYGDFYQLMRNRLLADRMVVNAELGVSDAKVVLVIPEDNSAYLRPPYLGDRFPEMGTTVPEVLRATLKDPDRAFATVSPTLLLDAVEWECGENKKVSAWAKYMRERYGL